MATKCPDRRESITVSTASKAYIGPSRLVRITVSAPSTFKSVAVFVAPTPAFAIRMSHGPSRAESEQRASRVAARSDASATANSAVPPSARISSHNWRNRSSRRASTPTRAPCRANAAASARPIPLDAPVIHTTLPAKLIQPAAGRCRYVSHTAERPHSHAFSGSAPLGISFSGRHYGRVAIRPTAFPSPSMRTLLASLACFALALLASPATAPAQVKLPKPPDTYDATIRYGILADRNERVLQFEAMTKFLGSLGFKETVTDESDLAPFDPNAEIIVGAVPSRTSRDLLKDRRVQT